MVIGIVREIGWLGLPSRRDCHQHQRSGRNCRNDLKEPNILKGHPRTTVSPLVFFHMLSPILSWSKLDVQQPWLSVRKAPVAGVSSAPPYQTSSNVFYSSQWRSYSAWRRCCQDWFASYSVPSISESKSWRAQLVLASLGLGGRLSIYIIAKIDVPYGTS